MRKSFLTCLLTSLVLATSLFAEDCLERQTPPYELRGKRTFMPLPAGAVKPQGWLRDWAIAAKDGYTSKMDSIDKEFVNAWTHEFSPTCPVGDWEHGSWSFEGGAYWFDGLVRLAYQLDDPELIALAKRRLEPVMAHCSPKSIGHFYWLDRENKEDMASILTNYAWALRHNGLFGRVMMEFYKANGDPRALQAMQYSDDSSSYQCITITGLGHTPTNAINSCEDYAYSGNKGVAETLDRFCDSRDVRNDYVDLWSIYKKPPAEELCRGERCYPKAWVLRFHGVIFNEALSCRGVAGTLWSGRPEFLETAEAWAKLMDERCLQPHGALVEDELYGPTGAFRCTESCAVAAEQLRRIQMFSMSGKGGEADKIERLFFNAGAGTVTRDFTKHVYFQQPNRVTAESCFWSWAGDTKCIFKKKHYPLCCTAGVNQIVPTFTQYLWMATPEKGLAAVLYAPNTVRAKVADGTVVRIQTDTEYPFEETIQMKVEPEKTVAFPLQLRIPSWCENPVVSVNGENVAVKSDEKGFMCINRTWQAGDNVVLSFPMKPRMEQGVDRNALNLPMPTGGCWGKAPVLGMFADSELASTPYANVAYGPLLFVLPIPEVDENTPQEGAKWQYALNPAHALDAVEVVRKEMPKPWNWTVDAPVQLKINAVEGTWNYDEKAPVLPLAKDIQIGEPRQIMLVPYGCAKLRVSMFPVVEK